MQRTELLRDIRETLVKTGFYVSDQSSLQEIGFDLVARKDDTLIIIKVLTNIDSLSENLASEIKKLSFLLKASPLLIGEKTGIGSLEDDVAYFRFGIQAITLNTLKNHLLEGESINAYAAPGGLYVRLNEKKIRELRLAQGISLGQFARYVKVSRRTAQMYEDGMNARADIAVRIEELLGNDIVVPIEILKALESHQMNFSKPTKPILELKDFQNEILSLLTQVGYKITPLKKCPFEAVSSEKDRVLLTCVRKYDKFVKKAEVVSSISKITERRAVLFTDKEKSNTNIKGTPVINKKELKKIHDPEEIIELIIERE